MITKFPVWITECYNLYKCSLPTFYLIDYHFKGTVPRDFLPLVFFFKQLLLAQLDKPSNNFDFFRIFADIFDYFGASPVSLTPVNTSLPVSMTPVSDFTVLESFTGVNDTGKKFLTGVIDTGEASICRCQ